MSTTQQPSNKLVGIMLIVGSCCFRAPIPDAWKDYTAERFNVASPDGYLYRVRRTLRPKQWFLKFHADRQLLTSDNGADQELCEVLRTMPEWKEVNTDKPSFLDHNWKGLN